MTSHREGDARLPGPDDALELWSCAKPTIKILFYTDDRRISLHPDVTAYANEFGVRILHDLLVEGAHDLASVDIVLLDRHRPTHGTIRLTADTLVGFDEIWFFTARWEPNTHDNPHRELDDDEVEALEAWMRSGGVLMTGDHANPFGEESEVAPAPGGPIAATLGLRDRLNERLLGLGRSVGHRVPRAGLLRRWEGGPPQFAEEFEKNINTQIVPGPSDDYDNLTYQEDEWPQRLILTTYPKENVGVPWGTPGSGRRVHRLFCGRHGPIEVFPDHMHEGHVLVPETFPQDTWPSGPDGQPRPEVVARGTDREAGTVHNAVVAYDGSLAGVGRIVADSTWHHYFNVNLKGFRTGGSVLAQLAQYYVNLALWLAPAAKRRQVACWVRWQVIQSPSVQMSLGSSRRDLGRVAAQVARHMHGQCAVRDVLDLEAFASTHGPAVEPPLELLVGSVVDTYIRAMSRTERTHTTISGADRDEALLADARKAAFRDFTKELEDAAQRLRDNETRLNGVDTRSVTPESQASEVTSRTDDSGRSRIERKDD
jgi:hypothetical protein